MHATLAPRPSRKFIKGKGSRIENQQEKKDMIPTGGRKRKREGLKEGRRTAGRKKRRPSSKMLRALSHVHMLLSKSCRSQATCKRWFQNAAKTVQFTDVSRNTLQTPCHVVQSADDNFKMLRTPSTCRFELQKAVKIASK